MHFSGQSRISSRMASLHQLSLNKLSASASVGLHDILGQLRCWLLHYAEHADKPSLGDFMSSVRLGAS